MTGITGGTAVFLAAQWGHVEAVKLLADRGASIKTPLRELGVTPIWIAAQNGHLEVVRLLADRGANITTRAHITTRQTKD